MMETLTMLQTVWETAPDLFWDTLDLEEALHLQVLELRFDQMELLL